jgi:hypothetical protein
MEKGKTFSFYRTVEETNKALDIFLKELTQEYIMELMELNMFMYGKW